jgi:hypothetical protein
MNQLQKLSAVQLSPWLIPTLVPLMNSHLYGDPIISVKFDAPRTIDQMSQDAGIDPRASTQE